MTSQYGRGRLVEWEVVHHLTADGYACTRAASSKGVADVIAIKTGQVLLVSVKRSAFPGPVERQNLLRVAMWLPKVAVPLVAIGRPTLTYWRLTGPGPRDREPWTPDIATISHSPKEPA